ncbi:MAG: hypothetical protein J1E61_03670 [Lachnospiraceae bacterium]|nr:hypothetical protein [Lachnospiraceae bacterium]
MAKELLKPVYQSVYGEKFDASSFEKRMEMQKAIYILQEAGIRVGDYDFLWYKHGPYCQSLQDDILCLSDTPDIAIKYSEDAKEVIERVKSVINMNVEYARSTWVECLASLQYLRANVFSLNASNEDIVKDLMTRKSHLNNMETNMMALARLDYILG